MIIILKSLSKTKKIPKDTPKYVRKALERAIKNTNCIMLESIMKSKLLRILQTNKYMKENPELYII